MCENRILRVLVFSNERGKKNNGSADCKQQQVSCSVENTRTHTLSTLLHTCELPYGDDLQKHLDVLSVVKGVNSKSECRNVGRSCEEK